jgi:hypothetical protein
MASFTSSGSRGKKSPTASPCHLLDNANDWQLLVDFDHEHYTFPPEICATSQRPDFVIWSPSLKVIYLIELTCPAEENIQAAHIKKLSRYNNDLVPLIEATHNMAWKAKLSP